MATRKFLDDNGLLYYNQKIQSQLASISAKASFNEIIGDPMGNTALASLFNAKLDKNLGVVNTGKYLRVDASGNVGFDDIQAITNAEIDAIMSL